MDIKTNNLIIAEWITIMGTFLACFVFLSFQMEKQSARVDHLYGMWCETQKEIKQLYIDRK